jgi:hypothetical protein
LCNACCVLADLLKRTGRPQEAEQYFQQASDIAQRITTDFPMLDDPASNDARLCLANLLKDLGRFSEAEQLYLQNLDLARRHIAHSPTVADHWHKLALGQSSLVRLYIHTDQLMKA